ncbi:MAG: hypothetical protein COS30_00775 [Candidatus Portnoybacteria bacterium CG02_land_8_20_14_3_00_45_8]|uniref:Uncharacterized protein n=1 Tax=Candidatus Portnoybacteria bacterium CG02_land_8_20_14_3_00_45_8 TaxID=1974807 RepID=A0A2M7D6M7_9BACT|nr:MAG: hypothetical protein COS30_00775 [Candidatus Portnoybacteria bacterium CG02_land_8_20_14_3_00_45_8]
MTVKNTKILKLKGANMDIDLIANPKKINWQQDECPWNKEENTKKHKCAIKNVSICKYFRGIEPLDIVACTYQFKK